MLCKQGKVFLADLEKNSKDNPYNVRGKRPVMIISQIGKEFVEVIPISSKVREGRSNKYSIRVLLQGTSQYISLMCDKVLTIPINCLMMEVGEIDSKSVELIVQTVMSIKNKHTIEYAKDRMLSVKIYEDKKTDIQEYIFEAQKDIKEIKNQLVNMNSRKEKWKERLIGFIFGIIASVIATIIMNL